MFEGQIEIGGRNLPRTLLGTSPFIAAGQFGVVYDTESHLCLGSGMII